MPSAKEAEQSVIAAMIVEPKKTIPLAIHELSENDFSSTENQNLFKICKELYNEGKPVDVVTVLSKYGESAEAKIYIAKIIDILPTTENVEEYIKIVSETSKRRDAYGMAVELTTMLGTDEPIEACSIAAQALQSVLNHKVSSVEIDPENGFYQVYIAMENEQEYIQTGFNGIDRIANISKGDYVVVGARPSTGKTALTLQMTMNIAKKYKVIYFSLETSAFKLYQRMVACYTGTPLETLKSKSNEKTMAAVAKYYSEFKKLNFKVIEAAGWTVEQIKAKAVEERADIVFIDYLSLVKSNGKSRYEQTTNISIDLHTMAQTSKITVVALSQLSRNGVEREPDMTDLRESGQIEQDADIVLLLSRAKEGTDRRLNVAKNKDGEIGTVTLGFNGSVQRFLEYEYRY